jgi:hypothetical protein
MLFHANHVHPSDPSLIAAREGESQAEKKAQLKDKSKRTVNWRKKRPRPLDVTEVRKTVEQESGVEKTPEKAAVSKTWRRNS